MKGHTNSRTGSVICESFTNILTDNTKKGADLFVENVTDSFYLNWNSLYTDMYGVAWVNYSTIPDLRFGNHTFDD